MNRLLLLLCLFATTYGALRRYRPPRTSPNSITDNQKIVGGSPAFISQYPYLVSVQASRSHICGGAIISDNVILTAAHCVSYRTNVSPRELTIRAGSSYHNTGGTVYQVSDFRRHPSYVARKTDNDFALLMLASNISSSTGAMRITLSNREPSANDQISISGWGTTSMGGSSPRQLRQATVPVVDRNTCIRNYSAAGGEITQNMFCAGQSNGGVDSCQGDSGGPAMHNGYLVGVVSWGYGCAQPGYPGVYATVARARPWIKTMTGL